MALDALFGLFGDGGTIDTAMLGQLATVFARLSLIAVGGFNPMIPEMHRLFVDEMSLMSEAQFATLFAVTQGAPGPNVLIVAAIGWQVAGIPGALVSLGAVCGPSALLAGTVASLRDRLAQSDFARAVQRGLIPVTVGLIAASALVVARGAAISGDSAPASVTLTVLTVLIIIRYNPHPLWLLGTGALIGAIGLV
jgi:chromate transporter